MSSKVADSGSTDFERIRLNERISSIEDREVLKGLRRYRAYINTLKEIQKRQIAAFPRVTSHGTRYRAADEVVLCHRWLDERVGKSDHV